MTEKTIKSYNEPGKRLQLVKRTDEKLHITQYLIYENRRIIVRSVNLEWICRKFQSKIYELTMQTNLL